MAPVRVPDICRWEHLEGRELTCARQLIWPARRACKFWPAPFRVGASSALLVARYLTRELTWPSGGDARAADQLLARVSPARGCRRTWLHLLSGGGGGSSGDQDDPRQPDQPVDHPPLSRPTNGRRLIWLLCQIPPTDRWRRSTSGRCADRLRAHELAYKWRPPVPARLRHPHRTAIKSERDSHGAPSAQDRRRAGRPGAPWRPCGRAQPSPSAPPVTPAQQVSERASRNLTCRWADRAGLALLGPARPACN